VPPPRSPILFFFFFSLFFLFFFFLFFYPGHSTVLSARFPLSPATVLTLFLPPKRRLVLVHGSPRSFIWTAHGSLLPADVAPYDSAHASSFRLRIVTSGGASRFPSCVFVSGDASRQFLLLFRIPDFPDSRSISSPALCVSLICRPPVFLPSLFLFCH